jgi:hypothetical protein
MQRSNPEMQKRAANAIQQRNGGSRHNPIVSFTITGERTPKLPSEFVEETGGLIDFRQASRWRSTLSAKKLSVAQERMEAIVVKKTETLQRIADRSPMYTLWAK